MTKYISNPVPYLFMNIEVDFINESNIIDKGIAKNC